MDRQLALVVGESSEPIAKMKTSSKKRKEVKDVDPDSKKQKATWDDYCVLTFIEIYLEDAANGNKSSTTLNKVGYVNLERKFMERTSHAYSRTQLKNQWDSLKKDWQNWKLLGQQTGLGWCSKRNTYAQTNEWWTNFAKVKFFCLLLCNC